MECHKNVLLIGNWITIWIDYFKCICLIRLFKGVSLDKHLEGVHVTCKNNQQK